MAKKKSTQKCITTINNSRSTAVFIYDRKTDFNIAGANPVIIDHDANTAAQVLLHHPLPTINKAPVIAFSNMFNGKSNGITCCGADQE